MHNIRVKPDTSPITDEGYYMGAGKDKYQYCAFVAGVVTTVIVFGLEGRWRIRVFEGRVPTLFCKVAP